MEYYSLKLPLTFPAGNIFCYSLSDFLNPAAGVVGSIIGGISSQASSQAALKAQREVNATNLQIARETNQANLDLYREQFANSEKMMRAEQSWNSEQAQVARLREAGLNPALAFGSSASVGTPSLPSASPAVGGSVQAAPYEAYTDSFLSGVLQSLPNIAQSLDTFARSRGQQIDNQTRDAYNRKQLEVMVADIDNKLMSSKLSRQEIEKLKSEKASIDLLNRLNKAQYQDKIDLLKLQNKFQETQNRVLSETNARDAARLAQQVLESDSRIKLNAAQMNSLYTMAKIAQEESDRGWYLWRDQHELNVVDMNLKHLQLSRDKQALVLEKVLGNSAIEHLKRKDKSELNALIERLYGFGFSDVAGALSELLGVGAKLK